MSSDPAGGSSPFEEANFGAIFDPSSGATSTSAPEKEAKPKERSKGSFSLNVYGMMQLITLVSVCIACLLMYMEMKRFNLQTKPPASLMTP
jgi:hypothetical protein